MTFREIIEREDQNIDCIWLYREGMFMKAYERSAFFVHTLIHEFKLSINTFALASERVVSVSKQLSALRGKVTAEIHGV